MRIQMIIEFDLPDIESPRDEDEKEWFWNDLLKNELLLHSNYIGDTLGSDFLKVIDAKEVVV